MLTERLWSEYICAHPFWAVLLDAVIRGHLSALHLCRFYPEPSKSGVSRLPLGAVRDSFSLYGSSISKGSLCEAAWLCCLPSRCHGPEFPGRHGWTTAVCFPSCAFDAKNNPHIPSDKGLETALTFTYFRIPMALTRKT